MMNLVVFGRGTRALACMDALIVAGFPIRAILAENNDCDVVNFAYRNHIQLLEHEEKILDIDIDLLILASFTKIIKSRIFGHPRLGTLNLHGGRLPDYRGASVVNWQIIKGEVEGGISILYVDEGIDTGDVVAEGRYSIGPDETIGIIQEKVNTNFPPLLVDVVKKIAEGTIQRKKQNILEGAYYHKRHVSDGLVCWESASAEEVHNLVRALTRPYPGAFSFIEGKKIFLWKTSLLLETFKGIPGRIVRLYQGGYVVIAADRGILLTDFSVEDFSPDESAQYLRKHIGKNFEKQ